MDNILLAIRELIASCDNYSVDLDLFGRLPDDIFLLQHYTLRELMTFYRRKYPEHSEFRALMSLSYFEDAEEQLMPRMFSTLTWETVKATILREVQYV